MKKYFYIICKILNKNYFDTICEAALKNKLYLKKTIIAGRYRGMQC